jgi:hypothetical protein
MSLSSSCHFAVVIIIGMFFSDLIFLQTSSPLIHGSIKSNKIISKSLCLATSSQNNPFSQTNTSNPLNSRYFFVFVAIVLGSRTE